MIIQKDDVPSKAQILHAVVRLRKDIELMVRSGYSKKKEDVDSLIAVANFLEMLAKRNMCGDPRKEESSLEDTLKNIAENFFKPQEKQEVKDD